MLSLGALFHLCMHALVSENAYRRQMKVFVTNWAVVLS